MTTKQDNKSADLQPQAIDLYTLSAKLFAVDELIKFRGGEPSLEEERANYLTGLADDLLSKVPK